MSRYLAPYWALRQTLPSPNSTLRFSLAARKWGLAESARSAPTYNRVGAAAILAYYTIDLFGRYPTAHSPATKPYRGPVPQPACLSRRFVGGVLAAFMLYGSIRHWRGR